MQLCPQVITTIDSAHIFLNVNEKLLLTIFSSASLGTGQSRRRSRQKIKRNLRKLTGITKIDANNSEAYIDCKKINEHNEILRVLPFSIYIKPKLFVFFSWANLFLVINQFGFLYGIVSDEVFEAVLHISSFFLQFSNFRAFFVFEFQGTEVFQNASLSMNSMIAAFHIIQARMWPLKNVQLCV